jgi:hypothetical protein
MISQKERKMKTSKWKKNRQTIKAHCGTLEDYQSCNNTNRNLPDIGQ